MLCHSHIFITFYLSLNYLKYFFKVNKLKIKENLLKYLAKLNVAKELKLYHLINKILVLNWVICKGLEDVFCVST